MGRMVVTADQDNPMVNFYVAVLGTSFLQLSYLRRDLLGLFIAATPDVSGHRYLPLRLGICLALFRDGVVRVIYENHEYS